MKTIPKFTGTDPMVSNLNRAMECIAERTPKASPDCPMKFEHDGYTPMPKPPGAAAGGKVEQFRLIRQYKDYVVAARWTADLSTDPNGRTGTQASEEVRIAKFYEGRASHWDYIALGGSLIGSVDGFHYEYSTDGSTRIATLDDAEIYGAATVGWYEEILPKYIDGKSMIYAAKIVQGGLLTATEGDQSYTVDYVELNGRVWVPKYKKIRVCVEGSTGAWFTLIRASESFQEE